MEQWKSIVWYEWIYEVSSVWRIKSIRFWNQRIMNSLKSSNYLHIKLYKDKIWINFNIHRLIAEHFIPNPENKEQVNHINGIKNDNRVENLEWCSRSENMIHSYRVLLRTWSMEWKLWKNNHKSKSVIQLSKELETIKKWDSISDVKRELWIWTTSISHCCKWIRGSAGGFIWKYL